MHARIRIADTHGTERIAMVAASDGREAFFLRLPLGLPVLQGHLHGHFDRYASRIAQKDLLQPLRGQGHQQAGKRHRRTMGQAAKHHVGHVFHLVFYGRVQPGMVVPVDGAPPGGHAIDEITTVRQPYAYPLGRRHRIDGQRTFQRRIGMPHVGSVIIEKVSCPRIHLRPPISLTKIFLRVNEIFSVRQPDISGDVRGTHLASSIKGRINKAVGYVKCRSPIPHAPIPFAAIRPGLGLDAR
ncbi:hypothetical protein DESC_740013 [Desulfosarcina cetonica]|nr:hypothetical protein DESC_740013 [Desulfosarcina cetonica]